MEILPQVAAAVEPLVGKDDCGLHPHFAHHAAEGAGIARAARVALVEHRAGFPPVHGERVHEVDLGIMAAMGIAAALRIRHPAGIADDRGPVENCVEVFRRYVFPHEIDHRHPPRAQSLQAVAQGGRGKGEAGEGDGQAGHGVAMLYALECAVPCRPGRRNCEHPFRTLAKMPAQAVEKPLPHGAQKPCWPQTPANVWKAQAQERPHPDDAPSTMPSSVTRPTYPRFTFLYFIASLSHRQVTL